MSETKEDKEKIFLIISIIVSIVIVGLWLGSYLVLKDLPEKERGTIGDMFGVINSLFSGLALAGLF